MEKEILKYLSKYIALTEDEVKIIIDLNLVRMFKKGTILLREGEVSKVCYMVLSGCVRSYYLVDGEEKTTAFYTEHQPITSVSYVKELPLSTTWHVLKTVYYLWVLPRKPVRYLRRYRNSRRLAIK